MPSMTASTSADPIPQALATVEVGRHSNAVQEQHNGNDVGVVMTTSGVDTIHLEEAGRGFKSCQRFLPSCSKKMALFFGTLLLIVVATGIAVGVTASNNKRTTRSSGPESKSKAPSLDELLFKARYNAFRPEILPLASDPTIFSKRTSPQSKSMDWLVFKDTSIIVGEADMDMRDRTRLVQRYAIMVLYYACGGADWSGFVTPLEQLPHVHECQFFGVHCNDAAEITKIDWYFQRMAGKLPNEIGLLTSLTYLDLSSNFLEGNITEAIYDKLTNLKHLALESNEFTGGISPKIKNLQALEVFYASTNYLTGHLPSELLQLPKLSALDVSKNKLTGPGTTVMTGIQPLTELLLEGNDFTGTIPPTVSNLTELKRFSFGGPGQVSMTGSLPPTFTKLTNLESLTMRGWKFDSKIPEDIGLLSKLEFFAVDSTSGEGTIPTGIGKLTNLLTLRITYSKYGGQLPTELGLLTSLKDFVLESTSFTGTLPTELSNLSDLADVYLLGTEIKGSFDPLCHVPRVFFTCDLTCSCCKAPCQMSK